MSASNVRWLKYWYSKAILSFSVEPSKPASHSRVRSGPRSGFPRLSGVTPGFPLSPATDAHVRAASNRPGALPDSPKAPRSFREPKPAGKKLSSEMT